MDEGALGVLQTFADALEMLQDHFLHPGEECRSAWRVALDIHHAQPGVADDRLQDLNHQRPVSEMIIGLFIIKV